MVLPGTRSSPPVLQPGLGFRDHQEDIIADIADFAQKISTSEEQYNEIRLVLRGEREKAIEIDVEIERDLLNQRFPLAPRASCLR